MVLAALNLGLGILALAGAIGLLAPFMYWLYEDRHQETGFMAGLLASLAIGIILLFIVILGS